MSSGPVMPNDPIVVQGIATTLGQLIDEFSTFLDGWKTRVDTCMVQLQNAANAEQLPDGGVTGQVPGGVSPQPVSEQPEDTTTQPSTDPTGSSTVDTNTDLPEDTSTGSPTSSIHDFIDPSSDDTITDPSGDDRQL